METLEIAGTGLKPSRIGLGTWAIGGWMWGGSGQRDAIDTIHAAIERGITLIDTAPVYGFGRSEEIVGKALAEGGRRPHVVLATKCGIGWDAEEKLFRNSSRARIVGEIEDSLRRLGTDVIDIYQVHWPDLETAFEETALAMRALLEQGKIRAIGVSNYSPEEMAALRATAPLHTAQPPYNLFERGSEHDVLPYCRRHGVATLTYGEVMAGFLWSEQMSVGVPALDDDHRCIVRLVDMLRDVEGEDAGRIIETVLDTLLVYCRYHFAREERVMAWCGFPGVDFHRGEHEAFAHFLARMRQRYIEQANPAIVGELRDRLTRWLYHHILIQDVAYKPYLLAADGGDTVLDEVSQPPPPPGRCPPTAIVP